MQQGGGTDHAGMGDDDRLVCGQRRDEGQNPLLHGLRRFATGCYAIWYPIKDEAASAAFVAELKAPRLLVMKLRVGGETGTGKLAACGLAVINPPWRFEEAMAEAMPWIATVLGGRASVVASPASAPAPALPS